MFFRPNGKALFGQNQRPAATSEMGCGLFPAPPVVVSRRRILFPRSAPWLRPVPVEVHVARMTINEASVSVSRSRSAPLTDRSAAPPRRAGFPDLTWSVSKRTGSGAKFLISGLTISNGRVIGAFAQRLDQFLFRLLRLPDRFQGEKYGA